MGGSENALEVGLGKRVGDATEADVAVLQTIERSFAVGDAEIAGDVVEGAAFHDAAFRVAGADVLDPLPNIAEHVEEGVGIGLFQGYIVRGVAAVPVVPGDFVERAVARGLDSAKRGVFPF